ncbi:MAG TPA: paraquat-inducible protein A [Mucilaginibacter sp.]|jgi:hypothetical protein
MAAAKEKSSTPKLFLYLLIFGMSLLLAVEGYSGYQLHVLSGRQENIKKDYSTINNITFGLFSVIQWRDKITAIVNNQIQNFELTPQQQKDLQKEVESILHGLINKAVAMMNKPQKSIGGKLKKLAFKTFVNTDSINAKVPIFAKEIIAKVNNPASKRRMADLATSKLKQLESQTFDSTERANDAVTKAMFRKYHVTDKPGLDKHMKTELTDIRHSTYMYAFIMLGCIIAVLLVWVFLRKYEKLHVALFVLSIAAALILLLVGLTTTMIEVDARIQSIKFFLLGQHIDFENQVLFFQSKSILDVVKILIGTHHYDSILVGILILAFSILFPFMKLISTGIHLLAGKKLATNKYITYFAFQSGKWSMADVMVVAILMTYIGLNGILESQLANLNIHDSTITSITTNKTALQPGYIIFVGFVLFGLVLSQILKHITSYKVQ